MLSFQHSLIRRFGRAVSLLAALAVAVPVLVTTDASANPGFQRWVQKFSNTARKRGIKKSTFKRAFAGITSPDPEVIDLARYQPEFRQKMWMYFDSRVNEKSVEKGREMKRAWGRWLNKIERAYGVDKHILLAIWSMESGYGEALTKPKSLRSVIRSLATLAYKDRRRAKFARTQLIHAMKILQRGDVTTANLRGSWAGAMGHTQFIPSSYNAYGQDFDGNGSRDIWGSVPDALATAANLLRKNGWRSGQTWGYEVSVPKRAARLRNKTRTIAQWRKLGVRRANGKAFRSGKLRATLKFPAGRSGPAFLMLKNFYVIKRYNNADKYALAVGHLADQIAGLGNFAKDLPRPYKRLTEEQKIELQTRLLKLGFYDGEIDGKIGSGTRSSIRKAQDMLGMNPDGYESLKLLAKLRRRG